MRVELRADENPRWTCCRAALGRTPTAYEFLRWNSLRWVDFGREAPPEIRARIGRGCVVGGPKWRDQLALIDGVHAAYDAWLRAQVEAGRFGSLE